MTPAQIEEVKRSAARAGALSALTRAKASIADLDPKDIGNGYPSQKEDVSEFDNDALRALTKEMRPLASKLAEETDLSFHLSIYDADNKRIDASVYEAQNLIPPIRKHTYAPDVELSDLISDEAVFRALSGIGWGTVDFQPLGGEAEGEPAQDDPQPSHQAEEES